MHTAARLQAVSERSRAFLRSFDIDGDDGFSLDEFVLFLVLLSMPLKDMQPIFVLMDADGSGELDREEFFSAVNGLMSLTGHHSHESVGRGRMGSTGSGGDTYAAHFAAAARRAAAAPAEPPLQATAKPADGGAHNSKSSSWSSLHQVIADS